jgi:hypothetical protein
LPGKIKPDQGVGNVQVVGGQLAENAFNDPAGTVFTFGDASGNFLWRSLNVKPTFHPKDVIKMNDVRPQRWGQALRQPGLSAAAVADDDDAHGHCEQAQIFP